MPCWEGFVEVISYSADESSLVGYHKTSLETVSFLPLNMHYSDELPAFSVFFLMELDEDPTFHSLAPDRVASPAVALSNYQYKLWPELFKVEILVDQASPLGEY